MKVDFARIFAQAGEIARSRSSVLVPLQWKIIILVFFLAVFVLIKAPEWIDIGVFVLLAGVVVQSSFSFHYFMRKNPDALRSEKHVQVMQAMDKGLYGDSDSGMHEVFSPRRDLLLTEESEASLAKAPSILGRKLP